MLKKIENDHEIIELILHNMVFELKITNKLTGNQKITCNTLLVDDNINAIKYFNNRYNDYKNQNYIDVPSKTTIFNKNTKTTLFDKIKILFS